jgi:hypothetical protein
VHVESCDCLVLDGGCCDVSVKNTWVKLTTKGGKRKKKQTTHGDDCMCHENQKYTQGGAGQTPLPNDGLGPVPNKTGTLAVLG